MVGEEDPEVAGDVEDFEGKEEVEGIEIPLSTCVEEVETREEAENTCDEDRHDGVEDEIEFEDFLPGGYLNVVNHWDDKPDRSYGNGNLQDSFVIFTNVDKKFGVEIAEADQEEEVEEVYDDVLFYPNSSGLSLGF